MTTRYRAPQEPVYQREGHHEPHHHVGHSESCGLTGLYTYILCLGGCGTYIDWPSSWEGARAHYCPPCWEKSRPSDRLPTVTERQAETAQYVAQLEHLQDMPAAVPQLEPVYTATAEERAWAREEIRRQRLAAGLDDGRTNGL